MSTLTFTGAFIWYPHVTGKKKQEVFKRQQRQHSTPKANNITTRPSAKLHSKSPASKRLTSSMPQHHPSATDGTVRTPHHTPTVNRTTPRSVTHHGGGDTSPSAVTINHEIRLRELFSILKGYEHIDLRQCMSMLTCFVLTRS